VDGIATADRDLRITTWNPAMTRITGLPRERAIGHYVADVLPFVVEGGEMVKMLRVLAGEAVTLRDRPFEVPETGRKGFFEGQFSPLTDESGAITGGVAIVHETTDRKNLERQFLQAQKMEAIGRLAGGVAHDFNNLLTAIMGYGQLMKRRLGGDEQARRDVEEILAAAARGAALTRQLLLFSRQQVVELQVLDLNQTISGMDKMLRRLVGEDVDLVTAPAATPLHVRADAGQIEQVLLNLAVNARDAMPEGGKLTVETTTAELDARYAAGHLGVEPGRYAVLAVSDTGTGMSAETRTHIFEPFFTTKAAGEGTGLGLSTVHGIVTRSGGHIDVYTQLGQGTTFKVFLPLAERAEQPLATSGPSAQPRRGNEVVLLVEDEEPLRHLMRDSLELHGYTVLEAVDGSEAIGICERREQILHLLVTDVVMPLMNGPELARRVARIRPELRVLFVSGYADRALVHQGQRDHLSAFLQKPFMPEVLAHRVRELLDQAGQDAA
jgi:PAS domain S-box-containing protein